MTFPRSHSWQVEAWVGLTPRQTASESMLLITTPLWETPEWFLENIFGIGADQEIVAVTADMY